MDLSYLRSSLRNDRPPVELAEFPRIYQRTRIAVNVTITVAVVLVAGRFDEQAVVVPSLITMAALILLHARFFENAGLATRITFDTTVYLAMAVLIDLPEVVLFIAVTQSFLVFLHVRPKTALVLMYLYMGTGLAAATVTTFMETQRRTDGETVAILTVVAAMTVLPTAWMLSHVGAQLHLQRDHEESLLRETNQLLQDKDRFVASVSHELRTPLTAVVGLAHTLADAGQAIPDNERAEFTNLIVEQSEEVAAIVDDLLVAARAGSGHLNLVVGEVSLIDELASVVDGDIPIDGGDVTVLTAVGDPIRVRQILRNLVSNASRYGGEQKRIRLSRRGVMGIVQIQDDGEAIPASQVETIFTAYGRAHDRPGRTDSVGLGLTVSRQLAQMMGGNVTYSHDGSWAAFELSLPLAVTDTTAAIYASPATAIAAHSAGS